MAGDEKDDDEMGAPNPVVPNARMDARTADPVAPLGLISPELALVDPELAAWARSRLPDIPAARLVLLGSPTARVAPEPEHRLAMPEPARVGPLRLILPLAAAVATTFAVGFFSHGLIAPTENRGEVRQALTAQAGRQLGAPAVGAPTMTPLARHPAPLRITATASSGTNAGRTARSAWATSKPKRTPAKAPQLIWAAAPQSDAYRVGLFRSGRRVFTITTRQLRVRIPLHWSYEGTRYTLRMGEYRWVVWPLVRQGDEYLERAAIVNASIRL